MLRNVRAMVQIMPKLLYRGGRRRCPRRRIASCPARRSETHHRRCSSRWHRPDSPCWGQRGCRCRQSHSQYCKDRIVRSNCESSWAMVGGKKLAENNGLFWGHFGIGIGVGVGVGVGVGDWRLEEGWRGRHGLAPGRCGASGRTATPPPPPPLPKPTARGQHSITRTLPANVDVGSSTGQVYNTDGGCGGGRSGESGGEWGREIDGDGDGDGERGK